MVNFGYLTKAFLESASCKSTSQWGGLLPTKRGMSLWRTQDSRRLCKQHKTILP